MPFPEKLSIEIINDLPNLPLLYLPDLNELKHLTSQCRPAENLSHKPRMTVLTGPMGIGKTALCIKYADTQVSRLKLYFPAKNFAQLLEAYRHFIERHMSASDIAAKEQALKNPIETMQNLFTAHSGWIAIYDGIENYDEDLIAALPRAGDGLILLNSAYLPPPGWGLELAFTPKKMRLLYCEVAGLLLMKLLESKENQTLAKGPTMKECISLAKKLGLLPLALIKYAAIAAEFPILSLRGEAFYPMLERLLVTEAMPRGFQPCPPLSPSLNAFVEHYLARQTREDQRYVRSLLNFCAFLHFDNISLPLLQTWEEHSYPLEQHCLERILENLSAAHIVRYRTEKACISISPLLQAELRNNLQSANEQYLALKMVSMVIQQLIEKSPKKFSNQLCHKKILELYGLQTRAKEFKQIHLPEDAPLCVMFLNMKFLLDVPEAQAQDLRRQIEAFNALRGIIEKPRDTAKKTLKASIGLWDRDNLDGLYHYIRYLEDSGSRVGIVFSTVGPIGQSLAQLKGLCKAFPLIANRLIGATKALALYPAMTETYPRGIQIDSWLFDRYLQVRQSEQIPVHSFVMVGYEDGMALPQSSLPRQDFNAFLRWYVLKQKQELKQVERFLTREEHKSEALDKSTCPLTTPANFFKMPPRRTRGFQPNASLPSGSSLCGNF